MRPLLRFDPAPLKARHDGWTAERQRRFIAVLAATRSVTRACKAVGKSTPTAYALRSRPGAESFAAAWSAALAFRPDPDRPRSPRAEHRLRRLGRSKASETDNTDRPPVSAALADYVRKLRELSA